MRRGVNESIYYFWMLHDLEWQVLVLAKQKVDIAEFMTYYN